MKYRLYKVQDLPILITGLSITMFERRILMVGEITDTVRSGRLDFVTPKTTEMFMRNAVSLKKIYLGNRCFIGFLYMVSWTKRFCQDFCYLWAMITGTMGLIGVTCCGPKER